MTRAKAPIRAGASKPIQKPTNKDNGASHAEGRSEEFLRLAAILQTCAKLNIIPAQSMILAGGARVQDQKGSSKDKTQAAHLIPRDPWIATEKSLRIIVDARQLDDLELSPLNMSELDIPRLWDETSKQECAAIRLPPGVAVNGVSLLSIRMPASAQSYTATCLGKTDLASYQLNEVDSAAERSGLVVTFMQYLQGALEQSRSAAAENTPTRTNAEPLERMLRGMALPRMTAIFEREEAKTQTRIDSLERALHASKKGPAGRRPFPHERITSEAQAKAELIRLHERAEIQRGQALGGSRLPKSINRDFFRRIEAIFGRR